VKEDFRDLVKIGKGQTRRFTPIIDKTDEFIDVMKRCAVIEQWRDRFETCLYGACGAREV